MDFSTTVERNFAEIEWLNDCDLHARLTFMGNV